VDCKTVQSGNLDETVSVLVGAQAEDDPAEAAERTFRQRIESAEAAMARLQKARWRRVGIRRR